MRDLPACSGISVEFLQNTDNLLLIVVAIGSGLMLAWPMIQRSRAEMLLKQRGVAEIEKIRIDVDTDQRAVMMERTGRRTVPQIYIGDTHVGGFDDLSALDREGKLVPLLNGQAI